jgi:hypothetical protein
MQHLTTKSQPVTKRTLLVTTCAAALLIRPWSVASALAQVQPKAVLDSTKTLIAEAKDAADALKEMGEAAEALTAVKEGVGALKHLGTMQKAAKTMKALGSAGSTLGAIGAGIGIGFAIADAAGAFGPSPEEKTMAAIDALSTKIDDAQQNMLVQLVTTQAAIERKIETETARQAALTQMREPLNKLLAIQDQIRFYTRLRRDRRSTPEQIDDKESLLATYDRVDIYEAAKSVHDQLLGRSFATNFLEADYRASFGDLTRATQLAKTLFDVVASAQHAHVLISVLQLRRGLDNRFVDGKAVPVRLSNMGELTDAARIAVMRNANAEFGVMLVAIGTELEKYAMKARAERSLNAVAYLKERYGGGVKVPTDAEFANCFFDISGPGFPPFKPSRATSARNVDEYFRARWGDVIDILKAKYLCDWVIVACQARGPHTLIEVFSITGGENCITVIGSDANFPDIAVTLKWSDPITTRLPQLELDRSWMKRMPRGFGAAHTFGYKYAIDKALEKSPIPAKVTVTYPWTKGEVYSQNSVFSTKSCAESRRGRSLVAGFREADADPNFLVAPKGGPRATIGLDFNRGPYVKEVASGSGAVNPFYVSATDWYRLSYVTDQGFLFVIYL